MSTTKKSIKVAYSMALPHMVCNWINVLRFILSQEEINICAAVQTHYVTDACNHVQSIIIFLEWWDVICACRANKGEC